MAAPSSVQQAQVDFNQKVSLRSFELNIESWNSNFKFVCVMNQLEPGDRRLVDPTFLVMRVNMQFMMQKFAHFTVPNLATLSVAHGLPFRGIRKGELIKRLLSHTCTLGCQSHLYVFKETFRRNTPKPKWASRVTTSRAIASRQSPSGSNDTDSSGSMEMEFRASVDDPDDLWTTQTTKSKWLPTMEPHLDNDATHLGTGSPDTSIALAPTPKGKSLKSKVDEDQGDRESRITDSRKGTSHLTPTSEITKTRIIEEWQDKMSPENFLRRTCCVCSGLTFHRDIRVLDSKGLDLRPLQNDGIPAHLLPTTYDLRAYDQAILDPNGLENKAARGRIYVCNTCDKDMSQGIMPRFALANWLYFAREHLPPNVKEAFNEMSVFEKALICRVRTNSLLCRFRGIEEADDEPLFKRGKRHIKGNIISTPLNVVQVNESLPPSPSVIGDTICALLITSKPPSRDTIERLHPILVRRSRIKLLIEFLINNNPHYSTSQSFHGFNQAHYDLLLHGSDDLGMLAYAKIDHLPLDEGADSVTSGYTEGVSNLEGLFMENVAYTLGDRSGSSYREMTIQALQRCKDGKPYLYSRAGSQPVPDINNPSWLSWAHPSADPFGLAGFHHPMRSRPISMEQQLRHLLNVKDPHFENDPELAFSLYNIIRKSAVNTSLRFCVPYTSYTKVVEDIAKIDKEQLANLRERYQRNPNYEPSTPGEQHILRLMTSISPVARRIPGSVAQKIKMRNEIRAMISQRGSPTLFVTINPSDYYNPIVTVLAKRAEILDQVEELQGLTSSERAKIALQHPVACAKFFDAMIRQFTKVILRHGRGDSNGIFGRCDAYYGTVETQGRGSLHCHMLIWLRGHLPPETLATTLRESDLYRKRLVQWIDSVMDSGFVGSRGSIGLQSKDDSESYHASDPHPGSLIGPLIKDYKSRESFAMEQKEFLDDLLSRYNWHNHSSTCWKYLRPRDKRIGDNCRFGLDGTTRMTTEISAEDGSIHIRRRHPRMTQFNSTLTFLMKCNTDVKFIGSGGDAKAFMYYVTDYITKAPLSMHAGLTALSYAIKQGEARGVLTSTSSDEIDTRRAMTIAVNSMLGHQEISHPQVMSYIMGEGEAYTSEKFHPVNWAEILRYVTRVIEQAEAGTVYAFDDSRSLDGVYLSISKDAGQLNASNSLLDYILRPIEGPFDTMSLYSYLANANKLVKSRITRIAERDSKKHIFASQLHPQYSSHRMKARRDPIVPVLLGPRISKRSEVDQASELWARDMSILFRPWRHPTDLKHAQVTWKQSLDDVLPLISESDKRLMENMSLLAEAKEARDVRPRRRAAQTNEYELDNSLDQSAEAIITQGQHFNVFSLLGDDQEDLPSTSTASDYLHDLIGETACEAFSMCHPDPKHGHHEQDIAHNHGDECELHDDDDHNAGIKEQSTFMMERRSRKAKGKSHMTPNKSEKDLRKRGRDHSPEARITSVLDTRTRSKDIKAGETAHRIAEELTDEAGLRTNEEQLRAFNIIARHAIQGGTQLIMYIGGRGGTGKSYLIETVVELFKRLNREDEVRLGAPTGIAASLIGGNTLHSLLLIGINSRGTTEGTRRLAEEWRGVKYLIVDEVSMVGAQFMAQMSLQLRKAKGDVLRESQEIFGGINMIFLGDFHQLSPPKQKSLYSHHLVRSIPYAQARDNSGIDAVAGAYLWRQTNAVVLLNKSKRHEQDALLMELLDRIRTSSCLDRDGTPTVFRGGSVIDHLQTRVLETVARTNPREVAKFIDAPVIVGSKTIRDGLNVRMLRAHARTLSRKVHIYYSTDLIKGHRASRSVTESLWSLPSRETNDSMGQLPLFVGMKVMITENVSVQFKIVNGSEGIVVGLKFKTEGGRRYAKVVYVRITSEKCTIAVPGLEPGVVPLFPKSTSINRAVESEGVKAKSFRRLQIPLVPAYSYTDYKSQGRTLERAIVDIASSRGQGIYVMLSRVTTLDGLLILRWFPRGKILQRMSQELRDEISRLEQADSRTTKEYQDGLGHAYQPPVEDVDMSDKATSESDTDDMNTEW